MLRIAVCDDEPGQIEIIKECIVKSLFRLNIDASVSAFTSGEALLDARRRGGFELVFLDISLSGRNGVETAKRLRALDRKVLVVFVTGRADYALEGYEARAFRYILKPVTEETITDVMKQACREMQLDGRDSIAFKDRGEEIRLEISDIAYIEAQNHKILVSCAGAKYSFYGRIGEIEKKLADKGFVRCQKGYLVNATHIRRVGRGGIILDSGCTIPVSSNYLKATKEQLIAVLR